MKQSAYNEDNYLDGNPFYIRYFEQVKAANIRQWEREKEEFSGVLINYKMLIEEIARFIKYLGYSSSIECVMALSYIINCGYLCSNQSFEYDSPTEEISCSLGTSIVRGSGCCRNFSQMVKEVLIEMGLRASKFYCYQGPNAFGRAKNSHANHVINLIEYEGNTYGIDAYNGDRLFRFIDSYTLKEVSLNPSYNLRYKPYYEIIQNEAELEDIIEKLKDFAEYSTNLAINPFDFVDGVKFATASKLRRSDNDFMDLFLTTERLRKEITEEMEEVFKRKR